MAPNDPAGSLVALIEAATVDPLEPFLACARALRDRDVGAYYVARAAAEGAYSAAGVVLLRAGLSAAL